jgi:hypothetical protein
MDNVSKLRDAWGACHFIEAPAHALVRLQLSAADHELLATVGLPVAPASALHLNLRFENVDIRHLPTTVRFLSETSFQPGRFYPLTGWPELDAWAKLDRFVVLGEVPNDFGPGNYFQTRFVCLDAASGRVGWVYPTPDGEGRSDCCLLNTSLSAYLASLLAYKRFRDHWPHLQDIYEQVGDSGDDAQYHTLAQRTHADFLRELELADPTAFKGGFWEGHAWNEAILLEV